MTNPPSALDRVLSVTEEHFADNDVICDDIEAARAELAALRAALDDAVRTWTFGDAQNHTHSWHDREDWFERHEVAREMRKKATP